ncbi:MAG: tRNA (adenosine(37)-N6)-dimethylallyltransferase MiaA [Propionibacteriaceae bacterium]
MTLVILGPTAVGKTALAVRVAKVLAAGGRPTEIVNADSMLLYRGMDIGTAKPSEAERQGVVHHLVDVLDVTETATVAEFQTMARAAIADCRDRGVLPLLVGGSALYLRAVVDDFEFPGTDPEIRHRLEREVAARGTREMYGRLLAIDPAAAAQIQPANSRRIVRALEVIELTGEPFRARLPKYREVEGEVALVGLAAPRPVVDERIVRRVDRMWSDGLVDEVRALVDLGLREGLTASRGLGYRQVLSFLAGEITEDEAREQTITGTRKFSRRQESWFRRDPRIQWLDWESDSLVADSVAAAPVRGSNHA